MASAGGRGSPSNAVGRCLLSVGLNCGGLDMNAQPLMMVVLLAAVLVLAVLLLPLSLGMPLLRRNDH
jgi:hypothetical protein